MFHNYETSSRFHGGFHFVASFLLLFALGLPPVGFVFYKVREAQFPVRQVFQL